MRVITGYASPVFIRRVKRDFPSLEIQLFIGMSQEGINEKNHKEYLKLCRDFADIFIYYQVEDKHTHRKLLEFDYGNFQKVYVGSANFTENGFLNQKELMVNIHYDANDLFVSQLKRSLRCDDDRVPELIKLYKEDTDASEGNEMTIEQKHKNNNVREELSSYLIDVSSSNNKIEENNSFEIEIVLDEQHNPHWKSTGINAWTDDKLPYLLQTPKLFFDTMFPVSSIFKVITNEFIFEAKLQGDFSKELVFINGNIYEYIREKIGLKEKRPINRTDLIKYGNTRIRFTKINDYLFKMKF